MSPDEYREILTTFYNISKIQVSAYCVGPDKEPDTTVLFNDVKRKTGRHLLVGLGDYLISKNDIAKKTLLSYANLVLQNNGRIAILLSAHMYPIIKEMADSDLRIRMRIVLPKTTPTISIADNNILVNGIKAYLEACEKGESVGIVKTARRLQNVIVINPENPFDELKHRFPNEFNKLSNNSGATENWSKLLEDLNKLKINILQYLATQNFTPPEYIFLDYAKKNNYRAWLYFINLKLNTNNQSYLGLVAAKAGTLENLLESAKTAILEIKVSDKRFKEFYEQRKTLLKGCTDADIADFITRISICGTDRIAYLTDNTKVEKQAIIVSICKGAKIDPLPISYPDLYLYLQNYQFKNKKFTNYFMAYKKCKLLNKIDDDFLKIVDDYSVSRPYNSLPSRSSVISDLDKDKTVLIFLDAFGVEYLGYVKEICAKLNLRFYPRIARANLPTITMLNRNFFDEWQGKKETPIKDLDELKHHPERGYDYNNSPYPIHLAEELEVIKTALERAKTKLSTGECRKVLIVSDHGASRLAVISPDIQIESNNCESKSSGRYCQGENLPIANNIAHENGYAIIADYSRFTGSRAASVEVHGGATLEEVIVPIIEITLVDHNIHVSLENNIIEISYKTVPTLILFITPDCDNVTVSVNEKIYEAEMLEKSKYKVELPGLKKGKYNIDVFENQNKIATKKFTVKSKGFAERDMF